MPNRHVCTSLALLALVPSSGCVYDSLNTTIVSANALRPGIESNALIGGFSVFQRVMLSITNTVSLSLASSSGASANLGKPFSAPSLSLVTGSADLATGQGLLRQGEAGHPIDLAFSFELLPIDKGKLVLVNTMSGRVDGYKAFFPSLQMSFLPIFDDAGQAAEDADGQARYEVILRGEGALGTADEPSIRMTEADLNIPYPLPTTRQELGEIKLSSATGYVLEARLELDNGKITGTGSIKSPESTELYRLVLPPDGNFTVAPSTVGSR